MWTEAGSARKSARSRDSGGARHFCPERKDGEPHFLFVPQFQLVRFLIELRLHAGENNLHHCKGRKGNCNKSNLLECSANVSVARLAALTKMYTTAGASLSSVPRPNTANCIAKNALYNRDATEKMVLASENLFSVRATSLLYPARITNDCSRAGCCQNPLAAESDCRTCIE